jgi:hypothetical protein
MGPISEMFALVRCGCVYSRLSTALFAFLTLNPSIQKGGQIKFARGLKLTAAIDPSAASRMSPAAPGGSSDSDVRGFRFSR